MKPRFVRLAPPKRIVGLALLGLVVVLMLACAPAAPLPTPAPAQPAATIAPAGPPTAAASAAPKPTAAPAVAAPTAEAKPAGPAPAPKASYAPIRIVMPQCFCVANIAEALGWYKDAGLDVKIISASALGVGVVQAVMQGAAESGPPISFPGMVLARANGATVQAVMNGYISKPGDFQTFRFYVKKNSSITGPKDIKGKRVGLASLGSGGDFVLMAYLQANGLSNDDVNRIVVPANQLQTALESDQLDVIALWDVLYSKIERDGTARLYFSDLDAGAPTTLTNAHFFSKDFIAKQPETIKALLDVDRKVQQWVLDNPAKAKEIVAKATGFAPESLILPAFQPPSCLSATDANAWSAVLSKVYKEVKPGDGTDTIRNDLNSACAGR